MPLIPLLVQLAGVVPSLMKYAGVGDKASEIAAQVVGVAQAVTGTQDPASAVSAVLGDPAKAQEFQLRVIQQQADWDKMYLDDIKSARERDAKLHEAGYRNSRANAMLISAYAGVGVCFFAIFSSGLGEFEKSIITLILGRMLGYIDQGFNFEFGTTRASKSKDAVIEKLSQG